MLLRVGHSPMSNEIVLSAARRSAVWGRSGFVAEPGDAALMSLRLVWLAAIVGVVFLCMGSADLPTADDLATGVHLTPRQ